MSDDEVIRQNRGALFAHSQAGSATPFVPFQSRGYSPPARPTWELQPTRHLDRRGI